ncbi:MAG: C40 family peptidase [Candidatus Zixiibacteriota bacterium]|nr:MAG: C40 family peptidase [candidate division Zixibacteria bacterium]
MKYGWVSSNLVDLWTKPQFNTERASQLFFARPLRIHREKTGHYFVELHDGYTGWVDCRYIRTISRTAYNRYTGKFNSCVKSASAALYDRHGKTIIEPFHLYYGNQLFIRKTESGMARIILPDNSTLSIKKSNLVPINRANARQVTGRDLIKEASRFLGVPYLWGGVTSVGFDCSGLVQTVLSRFGIKVPRDTKDQILVGEKVERNCIKTGDLLFFERHVGFAIGKNKVIHSSVGGGGVRINSLTRGDNDYREDLDRDFNQARRLLCSS